MGARIEESAKIYNSEFYKKPIKEGWSWTTFTESTMNVVISYIRDFKNHENQSIVIRSITSVSTGV